MKKEEKITIKGNVTGITFRNSDNWAVFKIQAEASYPLGITTNCTGVLAEMVDIDTTVTATGIMEIGKYGRQLKCESIVPEAPDVKSDTGVAKLLQRLPGIGPKKAMMAVQEFGHEKAWEYACEDPERIGVKRGESEKAKGIALSLLGSYDNTVYLLGIGLTDNQAAKIYSIYGAKTKQIVSEEPYQLIDIEGFGFKTVDKIALKAGIGVGNPARIAACILFVLDDSACNGGHIWHNGWRLAETVLEVLTDTAMKAEVPIVGAPDIEDVRKQVHFLCAEKKLSVKKGKVFSRELLDAEKTILNFIGARA